MSSPENNNGVDERENKLETDIHELQQDNIKLKQTVDEIIKKTQNAIQSFQEIANGIKENMVQTNNEEKDEIINRLKEELKEKTDKIRNIEELNNGINDKLSDINKKIDNNCNQINNIHQSLHLKATIDADAIECTQDSNDAQFSCLGDNIYDLQQKWDDDVASINSEDSSNSDKLSMLKQQIDDEVKAVLQLNILQIIKQDIIKHFDSTLDEIQKQSEIVILKSKQKELLEHEYKEEKQYECEYNKNEDESIGNESNKDEYIQQLLLLFQPEIKKLSIKFDNKLNVLNNNIILTSNKMHEINNNNTNKLTDLLQTQFDAINTKIDVNKKSIDDDLKQIKQENENGFNNLKQIINNHSNNYTKHLKETNRANENRLNGLKQLINNYSNNNSKHLDQINQENQSRMDGLKELINNDSNNHSKHLEEIKQEIVGIMNNTQNLINIYSKCDENRANNLWNLIKQSIEIHSKQLIQINQDNEARINNLKLLVLLEKNENEKRSDLMNDISSDVKKTYIKIERFTNNISSDIKTDISSMFQGQIEKIEYKRKLMEANINKMFNDQRIKFNLDISEKLKYLENEYKNRKYIENKEEKFNVNLYNNSSFNDRLDSSIKLYIQKVDDSQNALFNQRVNAAQNNINQRIHEANKWWGLKMENYQTSTDEKLLDLKKQLIQSMQQK